MQVIDVSQTRDVSESCIRPVPLHAVKPGRVLCYCDMQDKPAFYMAPKWTNLEAAQIAVPPGKRMLLNLETGRVVFKAETLLVYLTSCSAEAYLRNV